MDQYNASRKIPRWDDYSVVLDARLANTPRWHLGRIDMGVPQEIIKSVVFLGKRRDDNTLYLGGTAFFVIVPGERTNFLYLVAARHSIIELCGMSIEIRLNTTDGKFREIPIGSDDKWKFHPTEEKSVDVAVMPFEFDDSMDIKPIPKSMFLTDSGIDEYYLGQGDEVTITGLFTLLSGDQKNIPIVRRGSVAMLPEDKIRKVNMGGGKSADIEGYLIEVRSVGGLSGSPIFVQSPIGYNMNVVSVR